MRLKMPREPFKRRQSFTGSSDMTSPGFYTRFFVSMSPANIRTELLSLENGDEAFLDIK